MKKRFLFLMLSLVSLFEGVTVGLAAEKTTSPFTGVTVQAGDEFYLYNVESGRWLQGNNRTEDRYTTSAELGFEGMDLKLIANGSGWQIDPKFGNNHSINGNGDADLYMDTDKDVTVWTFEPVSMDGVSNAYRIKIGDKFLHATPENEDFKLIINTNEVRATWQIVTKEERIYYARQNATSSNPVDLSFLIRGNEFANQDERVSANWVKNESESDNDGFNWSNGEFDGGNLFNRVFEAWDLSKFHLSQTISGLPAGYYEVEARASESPTGNGGFTEELLNQYNAGTLSQYGTFYAGDKSVKLPSVYSEQYNERTGHYAARQLGSKWVIDGINQISYAMAHKESAYKVILNNIQLNKAGNLTIGIKVTGAPNKTIWVAADKFRLRYLGGEKRLISNAEELVSFVTEVNDGKTGLNAELTADIDMSGKTHTSIGTSTNKYEGIFDGKGHVIKNLSLSANSGSGVGFFGYTDGAIIQDVEFLKANVNVTGGNNTGVVVGICDNNTTIQRCAVVNSYISGIDHTGSIAGCAKGNSTISDCYSNAKVRSTYQAGGMVGTSEGLTIEHCLFMGPSIEGTYSSHGGARGLVSLLEGGETTMKHNVVAAQYVYSGGGSSYCQSLVRQNGKTLSVDDNYSWSTTRYGNATSNQTYGLNSNDVNGYQKAPGEFNKSFFEGRGFDFTDNWKMVEGLTYAGGSYPILKWMTAPASSIEVSKEQELYDFATFGWDNVNVNLTGDIDYSATAYQGQDAMIGNSFSRVYAGTFNGNNHTVTVGFNNTSAENTGLFCQVNGATITNLKVAGNITTDKKFAGGICARINRKATITNCESNVTITDSNTSDVDGTHGGIVALVQSHGDGVEISNCLFSGTISASAADGCGGVVGWTSGGSSEVTIKNCLITGTMTVRTSGTNDIIARDGANENNNYYTCDITSISNAENATEASAKKGTGELCYLLNEGTSGGSGWYQNLSPNTPDSNPVPFSTHKQVYRNQETPTAIFSNYDIALVGGKYQISDVATLKNFSDKVNEGYTNLNAELTANVDMTGQSYTPIGNDDNMYTGTIDGAGHKIKLDIDATANQQALVGVATGGATIQNLILTGKVKSTGSKTGGFIAEAKVGGTITITNCGNEATITGAGGETAAIVANNWGHSCVLHLTNVYNIGDVSGSSDVAAICAYQDNSSTVFQNVYNSGNVTGAKKGQFVRYPGSATYTNCYSTVLSGSGEDHNTILSTTASEVTSGKLCAALGSAFTQDLSQTSHPTFSSKTVYAGKWFNDADNDVYYNEDESHNITVYQLNMSDTNTKYAVPAGVTAKNVSISRSITEGQWIGLCLPFDYDIPTGWDVRELDHVNGSGETASMIFKSATTIEKGKPYIVKPSSAVTEPITATDVAIATAASTVEEGDVNMIGNFAQTAITTGSFYINTSSQLKKLTAASATLKGFRAYFTVDGISNIKALNFDFEDDATGINEELRMKSEESEAPVYNVSGQMVNGKSVNGKLPKGIYIVNGKKVLF